jgi:hypothetical protein
MELPPSPGYEPLLIEHRCDPVVARGLATLAVRHGRRRAWESSWERRVFEAIRFFGRRRRQKRAILPRAALLLQASNETSIIETIFEEAGARESEFIGLLQFAVDGKKFDPNRVAALAAEVALTEASAKNSIIQLSIIGPINIGNPAEFTIRALAEIVIDVTGSRSKIVSRPLPASASPTSPRHASTSHRRRIRPSRKGWCAPSRREPGYYFSRPLPHRTPEWLNEQFGLDEQTVERLATLNVLGRPW